MIKSNNPAASSGNPPAASNSPAARSPHRAIKPLSELGISPAPWSIEHDEHEPLAIMSALGIVCDTYYNEPAKHTVPDARLIAAAPKLYAKAWELITAFDERVMSPKHIEELRSALAEAAGEEVGDGNQ